MSKRLQECRSSRDNITLHFRCRQSIARELNPVENIWQFMRDNWLSNRVFNSHDDVVVRWCAAWNKLTGNQPLWRIMSIDNLRVNRPMGFSGHDVNGV